MNLRYLFKIIMTYRFRLTPRRLLNIARLLGSMAFSKLTRKASVLGTPALLMVEPTNRCNLRCPMCITGADAMTRPKGKMDFADYKRVMDDLAPGLWLVQFWNQGEPFLHEDFIDMVAYAKSKGIMAMTSTNGHFVTQNARALVECGLDEIIISLDGMDQASYEKHRVGGRFDTVVQGIKALAAAKAELGKQHPLINLQCLVLKHNEAEVSRMASLARELGADLLTLKSAQVYSDQQAEDFLPDDERFRRYKKTDSGYAIKSSFPDWCRFLWYGTVLNCDGSLAPCCFDKDNDWAFGNAFQQQGSASALWQGHNARVFRQSILQDRGQHEICRNCFEGLRLSYVHYQVL